MRSSILTIAAAASMLAGATQVMAADYAIDPSHTNTTFEIGHFGTSTNRGRFEVKEGVIQLDRAAKTGKADITIQTGSVSSNWPQFTKHLNSADLLNTEKFPTAKFVSEKFVFAGDKVSEVVGSFTFLGKTNPLTLKAVNFNCYDSPMLKREVCGGDFEANLDRTQYGMNYGVDWGFPKVVHLVIQIESVKQ